MEQAKEPKKMNGFEVIAWLLFFAPIGIVLWVSSNRPSNDQGLGGFVVIAIALVAFPAFWIFSAIVAAFGIREKKKAAQGAVLDKPQDQR